MLVRRCAPFAVVLLLGAVALAADPQPTILEVPGDSDTIQGAVDMAGPDTIIHVKPGSYAEAVVISGKTELTLLGKGKPSIDPSTADPAITVTGGSTGVVIQGFKLEHAAAGVQLTDCDHVTVRQCKILAVDVDGVHASNASFLVIEKNRIEGAGQVGLDIGDVPGVTDCSITGNTVEGSGSHGILLGGLRNVAEKNKVLHPGGDGIEVRSNVVSGKNDVLHNVVKQAAGVGLVCNGSGNLFKQNKVTVTVAEGLLVNGTASGNSLNGNTLAKAGTHGLHVLGTANSVNNNTISGALGHGLFVEGLNCNIFGNAASKSGSDGFHVSSTGSTFTDNKAKGSAGLDLEDEHAAGSNLYVNNVFPDNNLDL